MVKKAVYAAGDYKGLVTSVRGVHGDGSPLVDLPGKVVGVIHPGMLTLHPAGFPHGPHPKALANAFEQKRAATDEVAVMIDTRDPLDVSAEAEGLERCDYVDSWGAANLRRAKAAE